MNENELLADKIDAVVRTMFTHFQSLDPPVIDFSLFYNPQQHASWFLVIFFAEEDQLQKGLKNGACYEVYSYLVKALQKQIPAVNPSISFETGRHPVGKADIDDAFRHLLEKRKILEEKKETTNCRSCGHSFDAHQIRGYITEGDTSSKEGWIICPEENCTCFQTWSTN